MVVTTVEEEEEKINVPLNRKNNNSKSITGDVMLDINDDNEDVALVSVPE